MFKLGSISCLQWRSEERRVDYFQQKVVNLTKTKKAELKAILLHLLKDHHAETETKMAMVAEISVGEAAVASPEASTGASL